MRDRTESLASMGPSLAYLPTCTTSATFEGWLEGNVGSGEQAMRWGDFKQSCRLAARLSLSRGAQGGRGKGQGLGGGVDATKIFTYKSFCNYGQHYDQELLLLLLHLEKACLCRQYNKGGACHGKTVCQRQLYFAYKV